MEASNRNLARPSKSGTGAGLAVGVVGATGVVGRLMRRLLLERVFPVASLRLFSSARSAGRRERWRDEEVVVEDATSADFGGLDLVFFSAGAGVARELAPRAAGSGAIVIDNSSAWRADPEVPLVVADVNPHALENVPKRIVANPNCTTMVAMPILKPLHEAAGLRRLVVSTYQAISGAGEAGLMEFESQMTAIGSRRRELVESGVAIELGGTAKWAVPIACNVVPLNYRLLEDGYTDEEAKLRDETRKILELPELAISATCVRVPVLTGHSLSIHAEFDRALGVDDAIERLRRRPGIVLCDVPNPLAATGRDEVFVGRIRSDQSVRHGLALFVSGDNLRKGAALNAVQVAEIAFDCAPAPSGRRRATTG